MAGTNYPDRWSATENVAWKVAVPGQGNSSPIVWGDRIILTTAYDDGRRLSVLALRRSDGAKLWETAVPSGRSDWVHGKNGHASSTPATDGTRIYALFGSRGLLALDMDGRVQWRADIGPTDNYHGPAGSPLLYKDKRHPVSGPGARLRSWRRSTRAPASRCGGRGARPASAGARPSPSAWWTTTRSS